MTRLFESISIRGLTVRNRVWVSPMCQYSATDGLPDDWHLVHLGQFATGGAGLVMTESAAVVPDGRITSADAGIWSARHTEAWRRIVDFLHAQGTAAGMQLNHAGRKASAIRPWEGSGSVSPAEGGWPTVGPSAVAFGGYLAPRELSEAEIAELPRQFAAAARRALSAGFDLVEVHLAHGYLGHQFYSPLSNQRTDRYGGDFTGRTRLPLEILAAVRAEVGDQVPVLARISASDWAEGGWTIEDSVRLAVEMRERGVDLVDTSSGGNTPSGANIPVGPGYQVPFAERIRAEAAIPTGAVGMITDPRHAEKILQSGAADVIFLARALLRDPHWALRAANTLDVEVPWAPQYERARSWH